jgi:hypothetical protein
VPHGREGAFDRVCRSQVLPVLGGKIVEGEQRLAILLQAFGGLLVFARVGLDEGVERGLGLGLGFRHPDRLQGPLDLAVLALWQPVQHVCRLVHPAALLARFRPYLAERLPEPGSAIGGDELRRDREATPLQIEQQGAPVVGALARAVGEADKLLPALQRGADDDEDALRIVLQTRLQMNAVGPDVDVALGGKVQLVPALVLVDPDLLQPRLTSSMGVKSLYWCKKVPRFGRPITARLWTVATPRIWALITKARSKLPMRTKKKRLSAQ